MIRSVRATRCRRWLALAWLSALLSMVAGCGKDSGTDAPGESAGAPIETSVSRPPEEEREPLPKGVLLHLSFDMKSICRQDGRPYARDQSVNRNGAFMRDVEPVKGRFGTAISLDGKRSRIAGSDALLPAGPSPVSISLWFLPRKPGFQVLFTYGTANTAGAREVSLLDPPGLCFFRWGGDDCQAENVPVTLNVWHHCVVTYDEIKRTVTFYLDGEKVGSVPGYFYTTRGGYLIGSSAGEGLFDGLIDELIVFSQVLSENDVQSLYRRKEYAEDAKLSFDTIPECR